MEQQLSFADSEYHHKRHHTRKEKFLARMEELLPWPRLAAVIEPHYPKADNCRRPYPLLTMLRTHCMSVPAMEDALYEIASMRLFAGLSLDRPFPDHTTIMNFRHLLERHGLARKVSEVVNEWLTRSAAAQGRHVDGCHHHRSSQFDQE